MAKFNRKPLEKQNVIPKFKIIVLIPIIAYLLLAIWFWGNELVSFCLLIGLAAIEMTICLTDALLRKKNGMRMDRGDAMTVGAGVVVIVYMIYRIVTL